MTALSPTQTTEIFYPSGDGEPVAETYDHFYALMMTLEVLRQYLIGQQATVLGNQFLYYSQGFPKLRTAPDVMVIFGVEPGGRDNYKVWEEGQVPSVVFEMTSPGTRNHDEGYKKTLYEQLGIQEYWQFDPKGQWIPEKLQGYRLHGEMYELITDGQSQPLQLQFVVEGNLIGFYRLDNGEKLLIPDELAAAVIAAEQEAAQERQRAEDLAAQAEDLAAQLERYRDRFGELPE